MIAFGAMIGWGWVVSTSDWIGTAGVISAMLGFILGGVMIFFIGMTLCRTGFSNAQIRR